MAKPRPPIRLQVQSLAARRGDRLLFRGLNLQLAAGDILHLEGANGSGKTTLLRLLIGLGVPAAGKIQWRCPADDRLPFCYIGHNNALKPLLSARENLLLPADGSQVSAAAADNALATGGLAPLAHLPLSTLSAGQRRRLSLTRLLLQKAHIWLLDEPFSALDDSAREFWQQQCLIFGKEGGAVLITGHGYQIPTARHLVLGNA